MAINSSTDSIYSYKNLCHGLENQIEQDEKNMTAANNANQEIEEATNEGSPTG